MVNRQPGCGTCWFFDGTFCRRLPPTVNPRAVAEGEPPDRGVWPVVHGTDWCAAYVTDPVLARSSTAAVGTA